jgi:hypothetical protein
VPVGEGDGFCRVVQNKEPDVRYPERGTEFLAGFAELIGSIEFAGSPMVFCSAGVLTRLIFIGYSK